MTAVTGIVSTTAALGSVLGVALLGVVGWIGYAYVAGQAISAEVIKFKIVSDDRVDIHLEVRKDRDAKGYCTLRSQRVDGDALAEYLEHDLLADDLGPIRVVPR